MDHWAVRVAFDLGVSYVRHNRTETGKQWFPGGPGLSQDEDRDLPRHSDASLNLIARHQILFILTLKISRSPFLRRNQSGSQSLSMVGGPHAGW